jgi:hypothetical protein
MPSRHNEFSVSPQRLSYPQEQASQASSLSSARLYGGVAPSWGLRLALLCASRSKLEID